MTEYQKNIKIISPVIKGIPIIIICIGAAFWLGNQYLKYCTPEYESTAEIKLADIQDGPSSSNLFKDFDVFVQSNKIQEEVATIKSHMIADRALDKLQMYRTNCYRIGDIKTTNLYKESPFIVKFSENNSHFFDKSFPISIDINERFILTDVTDNNRKYNGKLGNELKLKHGTLSILKNEELFNKKKNIDLADNYSFIIYNRESLISNIMNGLDVTSIDKDVAVLRLSYRSDVPEEAADVVNAVAEAYMDDYVQNKIEAAELTVKFIDEQIASISAQLSGSENTIESFRDANNIININQQTETDLRKIAEMKIQMSNLQMNIAGVDTLVNYLEKNKNDFHSTAPNFQAYNDLLSTQLVKQLKELEAEKKDLLLKYTPDNQKIKVLDDKMQDITDYIIESAKNTQINLKAKYDETYSAISQSESAFIGLPAKEKQLSIYERYFNLNEKMYNFLNEKKMEAEIAKAASITFHRIIEPGIVSNVPVSPNRLFVLALFIFIGIVISIISIYIWDSFKPGIRNSDKVEKNSNIPFGGKLKLLFPKEVFPAFRKFLFDLKFKGVINHGNTVCISSYGPKTGKSFIANYLSETFVEENFLTLFISCDNSESGLDEMKNYTEMPDNYLACNKLHELRISESDILTHKFEQMLPFIQHRFQAIIIDCFSISNSVAAIGLMRQSHQNMIVLDSFKSNLTHLRELEIICLQYQIRNPFIILNREGASRIDVLRFNLASVKQKLPQPSFRPQLSPTH
ncbi:MAG: exopolysaccharide transport family protein [Chitinophagales bacterium]